MTAILDRKLWTAVGRVVDAPLLARATGSIALAAGATVLTAVAPVFLAQLIDALAAEAEGGRLLPSAAIYLGILCVGRLIGHVQTFHYTVCDQGLQRRVSQVTFDRLLRLPLGFHLGAKTGALIQTHQHALQGVRTLISLACASLLPIIVQMTVILCVVAGLFDLTIWLVVCVTIIAYALVFAWSVRKLSNATGLAIEKQVETAGLLSEGIANIEAIKNNTAESRLSGIYARSCRATEEVWRICFWRRFEAGLAATAVFVVSLACSVFLGLERVESGQLTAGGFLLLTTYMLQIVGPLEMTGYAVRDLAQGASYLSGWKDLLALQPEIDAGEAEVANDHRREGVAPAISFEDVSFAYGGNQQILVRVTLEAKPGETIAIVGATGAGKTSLLRLLQKHIAPDTGRVTIDGVSVSDADTLALRRRIAIVSQDVVLFNASLRYNLVFARPGASETEVLRAIRAARLDGLVSRLRDGLDTVVGERGLKLSGGERQRIAIARAILRSGDILLLDEATSSLDAGTERDILRDIASMTEGRTTLIVTHRLALAATASRIVVLRDGHVVETGRHDELLAADGAYAALWMAQIQAPYSGQISTAAGQ